MRASSSSKEIASANTSCSLRLLNERIGLSPIANDILSVAGRVVGLPICSTARWLPLLKHHDESYGWEKKNSEDLSGGTTMKWLSLFVVLIAACAANAQVDELRAGAAAVTINPPEGTPMAGYYSARGANAVLDNLYSKALVLQQGGTRVALVVCDLISLP